MIKASDDGLVLGKLETMGELLMGTMLGNNGGQRMVVGNNEVNDRNNMNNKENNWGDNGGGEDNEGNKGHCQSHSRFSLHYQTIESCTLCHY